jgi:3-hydroxyisobutyrate dehydrogenase-like beta-hydroxyacid dehydrogenase
MASDITHCGAPGAGQAMKIVNNMVLFQNVVALAEALALVRHAGVDPKLALETLAKGSADSFALRNHGMKAMLPGVFPERAFSAEYALKDLGYALELAADAGIELPGAQNARELLERAIGAGHGREYFPVLARLYER